MAQVPNPMGDRTESRYIRGTHSSSPGVGWETTRRTGTTAAVPGVRTGQIDRGVRTRTGGIIWCQLGAFEVNLLYEYKQHS